MMLRIVKVTLVGLAAAYVLVLAALVVLMLQPPARFALAIAKVPGPLFSLVPFRYLWTFARTGHLQVGDTAPDFNLETLDRKEEVRLSSFRGKKPVVLVFGSYTWPPFRREVPALTRIYERYNNRVEFLVVYILEAHATDAWQTSANLKDKVLISTPTSLSERGEVAQSCVRHLKIPFRAVLDNFRDSTEADYTGWPDRLYIIDLDGHVAYKSRPGPFGFKPEEMAAVLKRIAGQ